MTIADEFNKTDWAPRLERRQKNFEMMVSHVWDSIINNPNDTYIIETGCAWDKNNWEGQGQSTLIWDWLTKQWDGATKIKVMSIDITEKSVQAAREQVQNVEVFLSDSVKFLDGLDPFILNRASLVYLDSYDWTEQQNIESAYHHMMELTTIWRCLPANCMVVVDDRHGDLKGKHWMVEYFMKQLGIEPVFKNHQMGWIKPHGDPAPTALGPYL